MVTYKAVLGSAGSIRRAAWGTGGVVLLLMGGASFAVARTTVNPATVVPKSG